MRTECSSGPKRQVVGGSVLPLLSREKGIPQRAAGAPLNLSRTLDFAIAVRVSGSRTHSMTKNDRRDARALADACRKGIDRRTRGYQLQVVRDLGDVTDTGLH